MIKRSENINILDNKSDSQLWFEDFITTIKMHELALETNTASKDVKNIYEALINGNADQVSFQSKLLSQKYFVSKIIYEYLEMIKSKMPLKLAFDYSDSEILVWAEIADNDTEFEKKLILAEAKINAKFHDYGYDMTTTIVEQMDNLSIPNHFRSIKS